MKKLLLVISILLIFAILIPGTVMASIGRQNWQLNNNLVLAKYPGPNSQQAPSFVNINSGNSNSLIWVADQVSQGLTFPSKGAWQIILNTDQWMTPTCTATVGVIAGTSFTAISASVSSFSYQAGPNSTWIMTGEVLSDKFTISQGQYLALRITNGDSGSHKIYTGKGYSNLLSPQTDPGYPTPEVATIVLLGLGMAGLGTFVVIRRQRAISKA
jgi:hypothetical protein